MVGAAEVLEMNSVIEAKPLSACIKMAGKFGQQKIPLRKPLSSSNLCHVHCNIQLS